MATMKRFQLSVVFLKENASTTEISLLDSNLCHHDDIHITFYRLNENDW